MIMTRWIKLKEAAEYSAIGRHRLKELAAIKAILGFQDPDSKRGDWIFDRNSLDEYRVRQYGDDSTAREKALAIMRNVRL